MEIKNFDLRFAGQDQAHRAKNQEAIVAQRISTERMRQMIGKVIKLILLLLPLCAVGSEDEVWYTITDPGHTSGPPGILLTWQVKKNVRRAGQGTTISGFSDCTCTVYRDDSPIANVSAPFRYQDRSVRAGETHNYKIEGMGVFNIHGNRAHTCTMNYFVEVSEKAIELSNSGESRSITIIGTKEEWSTIRKETTTTPVSCSTKCTADWLTLDARPNDGVLHISAPSNADDARKTVVKIVVEGYVAAKIIVTQGCPANEKDIVVEIDDEGEDDEVILPEDWYKRYCPEIGSSPDLAYGVGTNGYTYWESYVAGLDPNNPNSIFTAAISFFEGKPRITWSPNLNTNGIERIYSIWGKTNLLRETVWQYPTNSEHRFFKVKVKMP